MTTANARTGANGNRMFYGFDLSNMCVDDKGSAPNIWAVDTGSQQKRNLGDIIGHKHFDLLARSLSGEGISLNTCILCSWSGVVKEVIINGRLLRESGGMVYERKSTQNNNGE